MLSSNHVIKLLLFADESQLITLVNAFAIVEKTGQRVALVSLETLSRLEIIKSNCLFAKPEVPYQESDDDDDDDVEEKD